MNYRKFVMVFFLATTSILAGCASKKLDPEKAPLATVTKIADGGLYAELKRGSLEVGSSVIIFRKDCKDIPSRGGPLKQCSNFEYGQGRVEKQLEDGHLFVRSDAVSVPVGAQVRPSNVD